MLNTDYTTSAYIEDLNLDGLNDVLRERGHFQPISAVYNDPNNAGFFTLQANLSGSGSTYYTSIGDLNRDDRPDLVVSDNGPDHFRLNQATMANGSVQWSNQTNFQFVTGGDDGFAGDSYVVGW